MATPTGFTIATDLYEYSRFEEKFKTIVVSWSAFGGGDMSGEQIRFDLIKARRNRDASVYNKTITITGTSDPESGDLVILLEDIVDDKQISKLRRGKYFIRISSITNPGVFNDTSEILMSVMTAQGLRDNYLWGLKMDAFGIRMPTFQPSNVSGVEVMSMNAGHPTSFFPLTYVYEPGPPTVRQLAWNAGPLVSITAPGTFVLRFDCTGTDYMIVRVRDLNALPTSGATDELVIEKDMISDDMLRRFIINACDWWENDKISVYLEPTVLVTDTRLSGNPDDDWDFIVPSLTYYPSTGVKWIDILFPYPSLLRVDDLFGHIANTRVVEIDLNWVEISEKNGFVQLVPFNTTSAFRFIGLVWIGSMHSGMELPGFWNFKATAGLRYLDPVIYDILSKKAAIDALTVAGHAFRNGISSQSISRDGVSESVGYTASSIYGIYGATIEEYRKFIDKEIKYLRGRYRGVNMVVL